MSALADRIARLDPAARLALAERLGIALPGPGRARLVAFAVPRAAGEAPAEGALRDWLAERLPAHMVPEHIALIEALPHLPNGKLDRRALEGWPLAPDGPPAPAAAPDAPLDETGARLAAIWTELLGVDPILPGDDFFELGGDSIIAIQMVSRARQAGLSMEPGDIGEYPTLGALAAQVAAKGGAVSGGDAAPAGSTAFEVEGMDAGEIEDFLDALDDD